ncbi:MAG TPA: acyl-CoA dehydrogenase family protein, partial [Chitinophagales bacterium]|nr:acyl-CoA dehydrogenase family protein [Chitinophagales bacterium]
MSTTQTALKNLLQGGEFLVKESNFNETFTPEDLNEEQQMIIDTVVSFIDSEVLPVYDRIEKQEPGLTESLLVKAGELGLLGLAIPEEYGGMGKDFNTNSLLVEYMAKGRSFSLSLGAHIGIGTLPIVYFGNEQQKQHYLPK